MYATDIYMLLDVQKQRKLEQSPPPGTWVNLADRFYGVYMQDYIAAPPNRAGTSETYLSSLPVNKFAIVNDQSSWQGGNHWFMIYRRHTHHYEVFDSVGFSRKKQFVLLRDLPYYNLKAFNVERVQAPTTKSCGKFCLVFAHELIRYRDLLDFHQVFNLLFLNSSYSFRTLQLNEYFITRRLDMIICSCHNIKCDHGRKRGKGKGSR